MSNDAAFFAEVLTPQRRRPPTLEEVLHFKRMRRIYASYKACFCDAEGKITESGLTVLSDMVGAASLGEMSGALTDQELRELYGRRKLMLHVINRLDRDGTKVDQLTQAIRESGNE